MVFIFYMSWWSHLLTLDWRPSIWFLLFLLIDSSSLRPAFGLLSLSLSSSSKKEKKKEKEITKNGGKDTSSQKALPINSVNCCRAQKVWLKSRWCKSSFPFFLLWETNVWKGFLHYLKLLNRKWICTKRFSCFVHFPLQFLL